MLYHYTSLPSLCKMLSSVDASNTALKFWATDVLYMNDPMELAYGESEVKRFIIQYEKEEHLYEKDKVSSVFVPSFSLTNAGSFYAVSFSRASDCLPMWLTYGDKGKGVNIIFNEKNVQRLQNDNKKLNMLQRASNTVALAMNNLIDMKKMEYGKIRRNSLLGKQIIALYQTSLTKLQKTGDPAGREIIKMNAMVDMIYLGARCIKHEAFAYEKEKRFYFTATEEPEYRINNNRHKIPYIEVMIPILDLEGITVGPAFDECNMASLKQMLSEVGLKDKLHKSNIPYRII